MARRPIFSAAVVAMLVCITSIPLLAEVFLNRQWDQNKEEWVTKSLIIEGWSEIYDRSYQNPYGEYHDIDSGPPYIIEAAVYAINTYEPDGTVKSFGSITFVSGIPDAMHPFVVQVIPVDNEWGVLDIDGGINFVGNSLDPITIEGYFAIKSGCDGGADPHWSGQHNCTWTNTTFSPVFNHEHLYNSLPVFFAGGNVVIENCLFSGYTDDFSNILVFDDQYHVEGGNQVWTVAIRNSAFRDAAFASQPWAVQLKNLKAVTLENCEFDNLQFTSPFNAAAVDIRTCGIKSIKGNVGGNNTINAINLIGAWAADSAYIRTNSDLPLKSTRIRVDKDSALAIGPESIIKFYGSESGIVALGRLWADGAVLTSYQDDEYGGDSDLQPQPEPYCDFWGVLLSGAYGIWVDSTGTATLNNTRIRWADGAIRAYNDITLTGCHIEDCNLFGVDLRGRGPNVFELSSTTLQRIFGTAVNIQNESDSGDDHVLRLDSVTIVSNDGDGLYVGSVSGHGIHIELDGCKIVNNSGTGIYWPVLPGSAGMSVTNSIISCNNLRGIYTLNHAEPDVPLRLENNLVIGNGYATTATYGHGIDLGGVKPHVVGNTVACNRGMGLSYYLIDNITQTSIVNNIICRNGNYGLDKRDADQPLVACNVIYGNTPSEIRYRSPLGWLYTVDSLHYLEGEFVTNQSCNPQFLPGQTGQIDSVAYDPKTRLSRLIDHDQIFPAQQLSGRYLCPDTANPRWYYIAWSNADTLIIVGNITDQAEAGDAYRIFDYHLVDVSPLVDNGRNASVTVMWDIDGDARILDGDKNGSMIVDIGADEYDPNSGYVSPIRITSPTGGEVFLEGAAVSINWEADSASAVNLIYFGDYSDTLEIVDTLATGIDAGDGAYEWTVPFDLTMKGVIRIEDASDPAVRAQSQPFIVKGLVLTRKGSDSTLIRYWPEIDSWRFGNDSATMWPEDWFGQYDYVNGIDPFTGRVYPPYFANALFYNAKPSDFPSWPTFVGAFGVDQCYQNTPQGRLYRIAALNLWSDMKGPWNGSCFGFGVGSALAFFDSAAFLAAYPEVGVFNNLHELDTAGARREAINQLWVHQRGTTHRQHVIDRYKDTPRETLAGLKKMHADNFVDGRMLAISFQGPNGGGHVVNPYQLAQVAGQPGKYYIYVYDSNLPVPDIPTVEDTLVIDSAANAWSYSPFPHWTGPNSYCFLMDSSASYLQTPTLPTVVSPKRFETSKATMAGSIEVGQSGLTRLMIEDGDGKTTGFDGASFSNEIPDAIPIIALTGKTSLPEGFILPHGAYTIDIGSTDHPVIAASVWDDPLVYRYSRAGVGAGQTDRIEYDTSLTVTNNDSGAKDFQLACLAVGVFGERQFVLKELSLNEGESIEFFAKDGQSFGWLNRGGPKACAMEFWTVSSEGGSIVEAADVPMASGAFCTVIPNWSDPDLGGTMMFIDYDVDGSYDDSLPLEVITSVDYEHGAVPPYGFDLAQNYPNPFNPSTTIRYTLPRSSRVTLEVYNILGQKVRSLIDGDAPAGSYMVTWDGKNDSGHPAATGVYFYRFRAGDHVETKKMLLMK